MCFTATLPKSYYRISARQIQCDRGYSTRNHTHLVGNSISMEQSNDGPLSIRQVLQVDNEIDNLVVQLSSLGARRNGTLPIYRLPSELIAQVFKKLAAIQKPGNHTGVLRLGWIVVTHVCQHWRNIALQHTNLWTTISSGLGSQWMEEMLARSASLPLDIQFEARQADEVYSLTENFHRAAHLHLIVEDPKDMRNFLRCPAPLLETCNLSGNGHSYGLSDVLFANAAPRLRRLEMTSLILPWTCAGLVSLVDLSITYDGMKSLRERFAPTYHSELYQVLSRMPNLESLTLVYCLPAHWHRNEAFPNLDNTGAAISLPVLKHLSITSAVVDVAVFLGSCRLSPTCKLVIGCDTNYPNGTGHLKEFATVLPDLLRSTDKPLLRLAIHASKPDKTYTLSLWTSAHPWPGGPLFPSDSNHPSCSEEESKPNVQIVGYTLASFWSSSGLEVSRAISLTAYNLCPRNLEVLDLMGDKLQWDWAQFHPAMTCVQQIRVHRSLGLALLDYLAGPVALHLRTITIAGGPRSRVPTEAKEAALFKAFYKTMKKRRRMAAPLERLYLPGYSEELLEDIELATNVPTWVTYECP
ncbi:hypothetical protein EVG20_g7316 [Dentipellis fragilis]|uniref:Uncharacterized protein n=1 Tax=Dentipellis fragilis TaxID=205917 RepID=A0A4Y9YDX3_9AGAM|nr:hypothetical protein EVG20_g7316 [Dentipellis fragilis]